MPNRQQTAHVRRAGYASASVGCPRGTSAADDLYMTSRPGRRRASAPRFVVHAVIRPGRRTTNSHPASPNVALQRSVGRAEVGMHLLGTASQRPRGGRVRPRGGVIERTQRASGKLPGMTLVMEHRLRGGSSSARRPRRRRRHSTAHNLLWNAMRCPRRPATHVLCGAQARVHPGALRRRPPAIPGSPGTDARRSARRQGIDWAAPASTRRTRRSSCTRAFDSVDALDKWKARQPHGPTPWPGRKKAAAAASQSWTVARHSPAGSPAVPMRRRATAWKTPRGCSVRRAEHR